MAFVAYFLCFKTRIMFSKVTRHVQHVRPNRGPYTKGASRHVGPLCVGTPVRRAKTFKINSEISLPLTDPRDAVPHAHHVVDGECDKLVTDDRHQFITRTVHLS